MYFPASRCQTVFVRQKEDKELEGFEEEDDDFFLEAEESENEVDDAEMEDKEEDELE